MAINRTPVLKRCRQLGIDPIVLGYTKESKKQPKQRRRQESEYGRQLREKLSDYAYRSGFLREHPDAATGSPDGAATATKEREEER